jgi:hypothetical protein
MDEKRFSEFVRETVAEYANKHLDKTDGKTIGKEDVYIVWMCKTLQNNKALASTTLFDGMYYEITYNGNKNEAYVDVYKKWENFAVGPVLKSC